MLVVRSVGINHPLSLYDLVGASRTRAEEAFGDDDDKLIAYLASDAASDILKGAFGSLNCLATSAGVLKPTGTSSPLVRVAQV